MNMAFVVRNAAGNRCSLAYCGSLWSENKETPVSFFRFPKDHARCTTWVEKCEPQYLPTTDLDVLHQTHKLCSLHFESQMFIWPKRLSFYAIPTLFLRKPSSRDQADSKQSNSFLAKDDIDISLISHPPSCSTPDSSFLHKRSLSASVSTTTDEKCVTTGYSQTPNYLSSKTPRILMLLKRLMKARETIKKLSVSVDHLNQCLESVDNVQNIIQRN